MSARLFVGHSAVAGGDALLVEGRGFAYGDGVFETMRAHAGAIHWWPAHRARLALGAARLRLPMPDVEVMERALDAWTREHPDAVIKLQLTRPSGGRGYTPMQHGDPVWALLASPLPPPVPVGGLRVRWCETRLALQPALAGIKHCNRLEQILARAEWTPEDADEGLMRDAEGYVVCATAANVFVLRDGRWWTPPVDRCGIAGVCRSWVMRALAVGERRLSVEDVETADAVILGNAVRGILPVSRVGDVTLAPHPAVADARRRLALAHPAFPYRADEAPVPGGAAARP